jgi:hypothetical protein
VCVFFAMWNCSAFRMCPFATWNFCLCLPLGISHVEFQFCSFTSGWF